MESRAVTLALLLGLLPGEAVGQFPEPRQRTASVGAVVAGNVLVGAVTATTRAIIEGKNPRRAFLAGFVGGATIAAGKFISCGRDFASPWAGSLVSATGTAMVSNGGAGKHPLEELYLPVGMLRIRVTPRAENKVRLGINAYETAVIARNIGRAGLRLDWHQSARLGTAVFVTREREIVSDGHNVLGLTYGPVIVISEFAPNASQVIRHEATHLFQQRFMQEAWGRPAEEFVRGRVSRLKWIPRWLELGVVAPLLAGGEYMAAGKDGPFYRAGQAEAESLEHR